MKLPTKPIKSATVCFPGDPSVGIRSAYFNLDLYIDLNVYGMDDEEKVQYLKEIKDKIKQLYTLIDDENCGILFDYEIEEMNKSEAGL